MKIVVTNSSVNVEKLKEVGDVRQFDGNGVMPRDLLLEWAKDADALFCLLTDKIDEELLDKCPQLKVIGSMAAGHDHIDVDACKKRSIKVGYTPNVLTEATAELAVALLLATSRRLLEANRSAESGGWTSWQPYYMTGKGLHGSTVGIYGLGTIGKSIAEKLEPFKPARILTTTERRDRMVFSSYEYVDFDRLLAESDFLVVSAAATPENKEIFNAERFGRMKKDAIFCNISRGSLVMTEDLVRALKDGKIGAAGLDVVNPEPLPTDHPLFRLPNCLVLPHIGSATKATRDQMAAITVENIRNTLKGKKMVAALCG